MPKRPSTYYRPKNINEALTLMRKPDAAPLAGGTTLLAGDVEGPVVDLQDLGLNKIELTEGRLRIGAMTRLAELFEFLTHCPSQSPETDGNDAQSLNASTLLAAAVHRAGPNTYRNAATIGGIVAARLPDSELIAALLVMNAVLSLSGTQIPEMNLTHYLAAVERPAGLITEVSLPWQEGRGYTERVARTPADYPIVSVTLWRPNNDPPRIAVTGIDSRPVRLAVAEAEVAGDLKEDAIQRASQAAKAQANHPGDFRGDADYRAEMALVLTRRVLRQSGVDS